MQKRFAVKTLVVFIILFTSLINAQGVTTSGLDGFVTDSDENPLVGANVIVVHVPSGIQYGASVRDGGLNPYLICASADLILSQYHTLAIKLKKKLKYICD